MTFCVLDGSTALAWVLPGEMSPSLQVLLEDVSSSGAIVPNLWHLEVANVLVSSQRRGRITSAQRNDAIALLASLKVEVDALTSAQAWTDTLRLSDHHGLTVYDAGYLEVALRLRRPLASLDKALREAARMNGVTVLG